MTDIFKRDRTSVRAVFVANGGDAHVAALDEVIDRILPVVGS